MRGEKGKGGIEGWVNARLFVLSDKGKASRWCRFEGLGELCGVGE